jgi:hypothetical protein
MLSAAVVAHGYVSRPNPVRVVERAVPLPVSNDAAAEARFERRLQAELKRVSAEYERKLEFERKTLLLAMEENINLLRKQMNRMYVASASMESGQ